MGQPTEYRQLPGWSQSRIKVLLSGTPAHLRRRLDGADEREPSEAMLRGQLVEDLIQRPGNGDDGWLIRPDGIDRRTKIGKEAWAEFVAQAEGKQIVTAEIYSLACTMAERFNASATARQLTAGADAQRILRWTDPVTGLQCKGLCDWLRIDEDGGVTIVDLKTVQPGDGSPSGFQRWIAKWNGDVQAAYYCDGAAAMLGIPAEQIRWYWIAIEADEVGAVGIYSASERMLASGRAKYRRCLETISECDMTGDWPGYSDTVIEIDPARWSDWSGGDE